MDRITLLKQYIEEDPSDAFSKYALALEFVKMGKDTDAGHLFETLYQKHSDYLPAYYHFGKLLERTGQISRAAGILSEGMKLAKSKGDQHTYNELFSALEGIE